jgi:hypothetical protein
MATRFIIACIKDYQEHSVETRREFLERFYDWDTNIMYPKKYSYKNDFVASLRDFITECFELSEIQNSTLQQYLIDECCDDNYHTIRKELNDLADDDENDRQNEEESDDEESTTTEEENPSSSSDSDTESDTDDEPKSD